ncbi:MAG: Gfo/Idh/MocA family oxidoreductase [Candidatus Sumerlaeota bacterium]|nr:Gfo/Idh/MocA family oxidoreductase [Candidatus Sumerlaeota bacterium]
MSAKFRVAFIGAGGRSGAYARHYVTRDDIEIVALADPVRHHRRFTIERTGIKNSPEEYDDWRAMLREQKDLDGVVVITPNYLHADPAVACLERGLPVALEKPLATTKEDCERILDAERANGGRTLIGFVLRSTPFYGKIKELLEKRAIGQIVSIQADELPGWGVSSIMNRGLWRRFQKMGGGALLEKCCHDMDILNWTMDARPRSLNSFGDRLIFRPNPALPLNCDECGVATQCKYFRKPVFASFEDESEQELHAYIREDSRCIYNIEKDGVDVQSVNIEYENGAVANFLMNFNTGGERASRNFHAVGHKGRIWGNMAENKVYWFDNLKNQLEVFDTRGDGSGHGGGDQKHAMELHRMMADPNYRPEQNAHAGYLSAVMCFAADISRVERRRVDLAYKETGRVEIR